MSVISMVAFIICFLIIVLALRKGADLFSPARVFGIIWSAAIGFSDLKLSRLQHEWNGYGWIMLSVGILSFFLGVFIVYVLNFQKKTYSISEQRVFSFSTIINKKKFFKVILVLFLVYAASYMGNFLIEGYLPIFHINPGQSRAFWGVFGIGLTIHAATTLILLIVEYIKIVKPKFITRFFLISLILVTFISYFFLLQRFNLMFAIIAVIVFLYYSSNILRPRNALITAIIIIALMYSVQYFRGSSFALSYLYKMAQMKFSLKYAIFTEPYMYISMNLENFVRAVNRLEDHTYGFYSFNFLLSLTGFKKSLTEYLNFNNFPFLNSSYNTYTMFWDFFRDFGVIGLSLIPFILGFTISTIYYKMRMQPSLMYISIYSVCIFIIFISFFVNVIGLLHFVFNTVLIIVLTKMIQGWKNSESIPYAGK